jgi:cytoskeletal protein CcmA (bactofilin family)
MFTRSSSAEPKSLEPVHQHGNPALNVQQRRQGQPEGNNKSVISNDLKIIGQGLKIITQGTLQVDGEVEGDVRGSEIIIGERGKVTGTVAAERVIVRGKISGVIRGMTVALQSSARVEGDIHHMSLAIEQGAEFDGRCRRPADASELNLELEGNGTSNGSGNGGHPRPHMRP